MRILIAAALCCLLSACVTTGYKNLSEVPEPDRAVYTKMHAYTSCCQGNYAGLDQALAKAGKPNQVLATNRSLAACQPKLKEYEAFIAEKTGDTAFATAEAEKLRQATGEKLMEPTK